MTARTRLDLTSSRRRHHRTTHERSARVRGSRSRVGAFLKRETARLDIHFRGAVAMLRAGDVAHLTPAQRANRARLTAVLESYARGRRFPRNMTYSDRMMPAFIDSFGTRCAVAHLMEATGETGIIGDVVRGNNNAFVRELAADLRFRAWLDRFGLTVAEAARIQPSYCFISKADACFCSASVSDAVLEATTVEQTGDNLFRVTVDAIHGDMSLATVGQELEVTIYNSSPTKGDHLLIGVVPQTDSMPWYDVYPVATDSTVTLTCGLTVPELSVDDAIDALLATSSSGGEHSACSDHLASVDAIWGHSQCDKDTIGGGCSLGGATASSPAILGTLVVAAAVWSRRHRARRRAERSR